MAHDAQFQQDHAAGNMAISCSRWPALVLPPADRPKWLPAPLALALHMRGDRPLEEADNAAMRRGRLLEPIGVTLLSEDHGLVVTATQERVERADVPALGYIDARTDHGFVELKTVDEHRFRMAWNGHPPLYARTQAQAYLAITGEDACFVGAIVVGYGELRLELFRERRHLGMEGLLLDRAGEFFETLRRGDLPPMDESVSSYAAWAETASFAKGERQRLLDPEAVDRASEWKLAKEASKRFRETDEACKVYFAARCGEAETIELLDGTLIERRRVERRGYEVQPTNHVTWRIKVGA